MAFFLSTVLSIWAAMHLYVFWRLASIPWVVEHFSSVGLVIAALALWASYVCVRILDSMGLQSVCWPLEAANHGIEKALANRPPGATILLSHSPLQAERAAALGAGLMLSGHTHNGQLWPFNYLVALRYPLLAGRYEVNGMSVIVCSGTGTWGPRMRLWRPSELLRVKLRASLKHGSEMGVARPKPESPPALLPAE